ncbi:SprB repeat-containing protein [Spirosoma sp. RP8]|uniref:SprB repeat-containing protein n=1 Tax=Spirosoma liriopis TaxID=2937440 RepID=A0ABT0HL04_9BACT|nr:T9SS type A sorting domain-containing protein [Spirosoma liriopis]MCK8492856.1 SprB repeat-containing protein [Spirosoma liriopis]
MAFRLPLLRWSSRWLFVIIWLLLVTSAGQSIKAADRSLVLFSNEGSRAGTANHTVDPVLSITPASATICAGGSVALTLVGCPAGGTVRWSNNQTGPSINVNPSQTTDYTATCTVTGAQGSTTTASRSVNVQQPITITAGPSSTSTCTGSTVSFSVAATGSGITYTWLRNGASFATTSTPEVSIANVTPAQAGAYTVALSNRCNTVTSSAAQLTVSANPGLTLNTSISPVKCAGTSTGEIFARTTGGTGAQQFQLDGKSTQTSNIFSNLKAGTYVLSVKDIVGCAAQTTVEIKEPTSLSLTAKAVNAKCSGGSDGGVVVAAKGGNIPYQFQINGGPLQTGETFFDLKDKTSYVVTAVDGTGCTTSQTAVIGAPPAFVIQAAIGSTKCVGSTDGTINVSATGGTGAYQYQIGTGAFQTGTLFTGLAANTYTVTIKDAIGCLGTQAITVTQPLALSLTAAVTPVNCFGDNSGAITLTPRGGTGAVNYQLTSSRTPQTSNVFKSLALGNYTVLGTDANGCTALLPVTIGKAEPVKAQASAVAATCCVCPTGQVTLTSGGGTGTGRQFQLVGRPYQASNQFTGLAPGTYQFLVADEVGCVDSVFAVVSDAASLSLTPGRIKDVACTGGRDGEAAVDIKGGKKPFTFYWQTDNLDTLKARTQAQTGLAEGTYTVSVLDSNRCTTTTTFVTVKASAPVPPKPIITQTSTLLSVVEVTGVQWYVQTDTSAGKPVPNATSSSLMPPQTGRYYVIVTQNGCTSPPSDFVTFVLTAIAEPVGDLAVRVVPNPVTDRLRLEIEQTQRQSVHVQLLDVSGRPVRQYQIPAFTGKKQAEWPLADISRGHYLLKAQAGARQSVIRVLVE